MTEADLPLAAEYVPPRAAVDGPAPVVVVLHGRGANEQDLLPIAQELPKPLAILSLRAPDRMGPGYSWYEFDLSGGDLHSSQPVESDFSRSVDLVSASLEEAVDVFDLDPERIGLLGFSQGTIMSFAMLLESPARYAWCVGLHGYLPASHADLEPAGIEDKPVFVGAGTQDRIIPASRAELAADRFDALGADVTFRKYPVGHGVGPDELQDVVEWVADAAGFADA